MGSRFCLYGYSVENNKFVVNNTEAEIVCEVFEKYLSGSTLQTIADELTERKIQYYKEKNTWNKNIECIKIMANKTIVVIFKGGFEVTESLEE